MGLVLVVAVGGALLYMANKHAWYGRLSCYLRNRGRSSVSVSAQINVDMTGAHPTRFWDLVEARTC